jgi:[ribosomal protein S5]-alanine N-acetyltransferase
MAKARAKPSTRAKWRAFQRARTRAPQKYLTLPTLLETPVCVSHPCRVPSAGHSLMEISLLSCDLALLELAVENPTALEERLGARIASSWEDFASAMKVSREKLRANSALSGWWTHLLLVGAPPMVVGVCGYAGPPAADGVVEIAYAIAPSYRGQGLATLAAAELTRRAFRDVRVRLVCAHTLPEHNASTRVLEKLGISFVGYANDVDEGPVWRWELTRPEDRPEARLNATTDIIPPTESCSN